MAVAGIAFFQLEGAQKADVQPFVMPQMAAFWLVRNLPQKPMILIRLPHYKHTERILSFTKLLSFRPVGGVRARGAAAQAGRKPATRYTTQK
jgi:hypothetical protein